jgi:hypothetical protein
MTIQIAGASISGAFIQVITTTGAAVLSGSNYLTVPAGSNMVLGTGDFTIETWLYPTAAFGTLSRFFLLGPSGGSGYLIFYPNTSGQILYGKSGSSATITTTGTLTLNHWTHVAISRISGTTTIYFNGVAVGSAADTNNWPQATTLYMGTDAASHYFTGYMSNMRIVIGVGVYTTNFTPPSSNLTATQSTNVNGNPSAAITGTQTALLLNTPNSSNFLTDSSTFNRTVTNVGSVTSTSSAPF